MYNYHDLHTIANRTRWRYLDSLDSIRYTDDYIGICQLTQKRLVQAQIDIYLTLLMGHGIVLPSNQLIDSLGGLKLVAQIISAANQEKEFVFVPIKSSGFSYWGKVKSLDNDSLDMFDLAAFLFELGHEKFELSAWRQINLEDERRKEWAIALRNQTIPDQRYINELEIPLYLNLYTILSFFTNHRDYQSMAKSITDERKTTANYIANLGKKDKNAFENFKILDNEQFHLCLDIGKVWKNLRDSGISIDKRTDVKQALRYNQENCCQQLDGSLWGDVTIGVMKTADSIYNFSQAVGTNARTDCYSESMSSKIFLDYREKENAKNKKWGYDEAAFTLATWAKKRYQDEFCKDQQRIIGSHQKAKLNIDIPNEKFSFPNDNEIWQKFFYYQKEPIWQESVTTYLNSLDKFENAKKMFLEATSKKELTDRGRKNIKDLAKEYNENLINHIHLVVPIVLSSFYKIESNATNLEQIKLFDAEGNFLQECSFEDFAKDFEIDGIELITKQAKENAKDDEIKVFNS